MNFALAEMPLPLRFRPTAPMSDDELMRFCAANDFLRVERDANGEILVMTPAGSKTSSMNSRITRLLDEWAEADGRGIAFDSNGGFNLPDGSMRSADAAWVELSRWEALTEAEQARYAPLSPDFILDCVPLAITSPHSKRRWNSGWQTEFNSGGSSIPKTRQFLSIDQERNQRFLVTQLRFRGVDPWLALSW
jgi:hypothetical protein